MQIDGVTLEAKQQAATGIRLPCGIRETANSSHEHLLKCRATALTPMLPTLMPLVYRCIGVT